MFWGCFSYDKKGPFHIWSKETAAEKKQATKELDEINEAIEKDCKLEWELFTGMRRTGLRGKPGKKPVWRFTKDTGKVTREGQKGVIDWYRYQKKILIPKLLPFAKECMVDRPNTVVQEDNAPSHAHKNQHKVYMDWGVNRLFWCPNSPDMNMIEPCWYWMKRRTTRHRPLRNNKEASLRWQICWSELSQKRIQKWIERIPRHIQEVIEAGGGNEYREGRKNGIIRPYDSEERRRRYRVGFNQPEDDNWEDG